MRRTTMTSGSAARIWLKASADKAVRTLDHARIHVAYRDNSEASCLAEWIFFNARSLVRAEAQGDANYVLTLGRIRQEKLRTAR
jgi:hypothetical protein